MGTCDWTSVTDNQRSFPLLPARSKRQQALEELKANRLVDTPSWSNGNLNIRYAPAFLRLVCHVMTLLPVVRWGRRLITNTLDGK